MFPGLIEDDSIIAVQETNSVLVELGQVWKSFLNNLYRFLFISHID